MTDIVSKVTPLTRGIIWLTQGEARVSDSTYRALDYLLNGLLTAGTAEKHSKSRVIISSNFNKPLYVFVVQELVREEYESYLQLLKKDLSDENTVLVIDDSESFTDLQKMTSTDIRSQLLQLK